MQSNRPQIMIADDHTFVADACKKLLEPEFDVVATVGDGRALVRIAANLKPQVIIVDIGMPLLNGLDAGCQVKRILPSVKLVFLTMNTDPVLAAEAFRRGASGYLLKTCAASELIVAIREVLKGGRISPRQSPKKQSISCCARTRNLLKKGNGSPSGSAKCCSC